MGRTTTGCAALPCSCRLAACLRICTHACGFLFFYCYCFAQRLFVSFSRQMKTNCYKCGEKKPDGMNAGSAQSPQKPHNFKYGDWMCNSCGAHNFRNKTSCFKCGASKPEDADA